MSGPFCIKPSTLQVIILTHPQKSASINLSQAAICQLHSHWPLCHLIPSSTSTCHPDSWGINGLFMVLGSFGNPRDWWATHGKHVLPSVLGGFAQQQIFDMNRFLRFGDDLRSFMVWLHSMSVPRWVVMGAVDVKFTAIKCSGLRLSFTYWWSVSPYVTDASLQLNLFPDGRPGRPPRLYVLSKKFFLLNNNILIIL